MSPRYSVVAATVLALAACLEQPDAGNRAPPMCQTNLDCGAGRTCDDGVCWGGVGSGRAFAAVLAPPQGTDLVATELPALEVGDHGWLPELSYVNPVTLRGRVRLVCADGEAPICNDSRSVAAKIEIRRRSRIAGGPDYLRTFAAQPGAEAGEPAFVVRIPPTLPGDPPYQISVQPDDVAGPSGERRAAAVELAPPLKFELIAAQSAEGLEWVLGEPSEQKIVTGRVVDAAGRGVEGLRVWALSRLLDGAPLERSSSIATTDATGTYRVLIPNATLDTFELVLKPAPDTAAPTLRIANLRLPDPIDPTLPLQLGEVRLPSYRSPISANVAVMGFDTSGQSVPVAGAEVRMSTVLAETEQMSAIYTTQGFTDAAGVAALQVIVGDEATPRTYLVRVIAPPSTQHGSLLDLERSITGVSGGGLEPIQLRRRAPVSGTIVSSEGMAIAGATVVARPSSALLERLEPRDRELLTGLQPASATSSSGGEFVLWLDRELDNRRVDYDIEVIPPEGSNAPRWVADEIALEGADEVGSVSLPSRLVELPAPRYVRSIVRDPAGEPVADAEVLLYEISDAACDPALASCAAAPLRGVFRTDADGLLRAIVPAVP